MTEQTATRTDIAIIGGGTVGSALALGITQRTGFSVTVVDANSLDNSQQHPGFDARVIALARRTVDEFTALGADVRQLNAAPIQHIQVSDKGAAGLCNLHANTFGLDAFGHVIALSALGPLLNNAIGRAARRIENTTVDAAQQSNEHVALSLSNGETLSARLVVLADGGRSPLAESLGFARQAETYDQVAVICNVTLSEPHHNKAYERFTADGPLAFLPFNTDKKNAGNAFSVVWTVRPELAEQLVAMTDAQFIRALQKAFGYRHGAIRKAGERQQYPLALRYTDRLTAHRVAVVGNAAQTLHPIAGQGFNLGLRDIIALTHTLTNNDDPGCFGALREYARARQSDRDQTIWLTDTLVRSFSNTMKPLVAGRNIGLIAMDNLHAIQQRFVRQTTGYGQSTTGN